MILQPDADAYLRSIARLVEHYDGRMPDAAVEAHRALVQQHQAVGHPGFFDQVRGPEHRHAAGVAQAAHGVEQVLARGRVQAHRGLVHQQHGRFVQQGAHQFHLAPRAAREAAHHGPGLIAQAHGRQPVGDALFGHRARQAVQVGVEQQVGHHREVHVERALLEHHAQRSERTAGVALHVVAHHHDRALVGAEQAGQQLQQGGLAGAVGPQQGQHFTGLQRHAHALECGFAVVGLVQVLRGQQAGFWHGCCVRGGRFNWRIGPAGSCV